MDPERFGGGERRHRQRAQRLAAAADHDSVTEDLLAGGGRFSGTFYLYDAPAVAYLDEDEGPRFALFNHMKGVDGFDGGDGPDRNGITLVLVTGRRVLVLVGREEGDRTLSLHYDVITGVDYEAGELHHRIGVATAEDEYTLWISRQFDEADLERAVSFVRDRMVDPDVIVERADAESGAAPGEGSVASDGGPAGDPVAEAPDEGWAAVPSDDDPAQSANDGPADADPEGSGGPAAPDVTGSGDSTGTGGSGDPADFGGSGDPADTDGTDGADTDTDGTDGADTDADGIDGVDTDAGESDEGMTAGGSGGSGTDDEADPLARIEKLHSLKEAGAITEAEYEEKKAELLDRV